MKITKQLAKEVAEIICRKAFTDKLKVLEKETAEYCAMLAESKVNADIQKMFAKNPDYFQTASYFNYCCGELPVFGLYTKRDIPCKNGYANKAVSITREQYEVIRSKTDLKKQMKSEYDLLFTQIESTLVSLGTFKRIEDQFPEAFIYLPTESKQNTTVALPIGNIRDIMNKYGVK